MAGLPGAAEVTGLIELATDGPPDPPQFRHSVPSDSWP